MKLEHFLSWCRLRNASVWFEDGAITIALSVPPHVLVTREASVGDSLHERLTTAVEAAESALAREEAA